MIYFVGAGSGAVDLITVRGAELLKRAGIVIYTGSLVNPALLDYCKSGCEIHDSAKMTLEEVIAIIQHNKDKTVVRLHTGDPCLFGAVGEQYDALEKLGIPFEVCPGVSSFCAAAAALKIEYTLPGVSQTLTITRVAGKTPVPDGKSAVYFLSAGLMDKIQAEYPPEMPAAVVYKASWEGEKVYRCTVGELDKIDVKKHALVLVGDFLEGACDRSKLYDPTFATAFREASQ
ncbi:MAG: cobalt-precorrin-4/precorrin-4 C(11)-methyltransferase [Clostridiales bacterium]|jgi:precorrin-4/cobalt-precorrin-4 C11-methyltransferase|nr:cobalt-precorrin-4/precorrin-4 C(11)-methyltransferase [Clostridiales bacterium]